MISTDRPDAFKRLFHIIKILRSKNGCPWDQKQTPESIKKYLLEETKELAEAIENNDIQNIQEELGDLLFIVSMLITMYEEKRLFAADQVLDGICDKMIQRHPHVFDGVPIGSEQELRKQWEHIKALEKNKQKNTIQ